MVNAFVQDASGKTVSGVTGSGLPSAPAAVALQDERLVAAHDDDRPPGHVPDRPGIGDEPINVPSRVGGPSRRPGDRQHSVGSTHEHGSHPRVGYIRLPRFRTTSRGQPAAGRCTAASRAGRSLPIFAPDASGVRKFQRRNHDFRAKVP